MLEAGNSSWNELAAVAGGCQHGHKGEGGGHYWVSDVSGALGIE